jgi:hypothetical protein
MNLVQALLRKESIVCNGLFSKDMGFRDSLGNQRESPAEKLKPMSDPRSEPQVFQTFRGVRSCSNLSVGIVA